MDKICFPANKFKRYNLNIFSCIYQDGGVPFHSNETYQGFFEHHRST